MKNLDYRARFEQFSNVHIFDFFYNQTDYLKVVQKCDLVIARSGSSIFEFEALGLHMILIPHPFTGNNHQYWNAVAFQKKGHELLKQKDINSLGTILRKIIEVNRKKTSKSVDFSIYENIYKILI